jgi:hypothetical protein
MALQRWFGALYPSRIIAWNGAKHPAPKAPARPNGQALALRLRRAPGSSALAKAALAANVGLEPKLSPGAGAAIELIKSGHSKTIEGKLSKKSTTPETIARLRILRANF